MHSGRHINFWHATSLPCAKSNCGLYLGFQHLSFAEQNVYPQMFFLQDLLQTCGKISTNCTASCFLLPRTIAWNGLVHLVGLFLECRFMLLVFFATGTITCQNSSDLQPSKWMHSGHMFTLFWNASAGDRSTPTLLEAKLHECGIFILVFFSAAFCWPQTLRNISF